MLQVRTSHFKSFENDWLLLYHPDCLDVYKRQPPFSAYLSIYNYSAYLSYIVDIIILTVMFFRPSFFVPTICCNPSGSPSSLFGKILHIQVFVLFLIPSFLIPYFIITPDFSPMELVFSIFLEGDEYVIYFLPPSFKGDHKSHLLLIMFVLIFLFL